MSVCYRYRRQAWDSDRVPSMNHMSAFPVLHHCHIHSGAHIATQIEHLKSKISDSCIRRAPWGQACISRLSLLVTNVPGHEDYYSNSIAEASPFGSCSVHEVQAHSGCEHLGPKLRPARKSWRLALGVAAPKLSLVYHSYFGIFAMRGAHPGAALRDLAAFARVPSHGACFHF